LAKVDEAAKKDNRSRVNFICNLLEKAVEWNWCSVYN
jgi:hypothetical protein